MEQAVQIVGALLVLLGFALAQWNVIDERSYPYLVVNAAGACALGVTAVVTTEWGFVLLEGVWTLVSLWSIVRRLRERGQQTRA